MPKTSIPTTRHNCATCRRWTGIAIPNSFCTWVEFELHDTGKCMGGVYNRCDMAPMQSCREWEARW